MKVGDLVYLRFPSFYIKRIYYNPSISLIVPGYSTENRSIHKDVEVYISNLDDYPLGEWLDVSDYLDIVWEVVFMSATNLGDTINIEEITRSILMSSDVHILCESDGKYLSTLSYHVREA